jgi:hypothetical protein
MPRYMEVPCPFRFNPPLTEEESCNLARVMCSREPAFDDRFVQAENYMRVYRQTGFCACPKCRKRREGKA